MRITNEEYVALYNHHIFSYIGGLLELYKDANIKPNHHLSLHLGHFLQTFGPVYAYWTFAFERINYMMQRIKTNARPGISHSLQFQLPKLSQLSHFRTTGKNILGDHMQKHKLTSTPEGRNRW